jgi:hypothetical protein
MNGGLLGIHRLKIECLFHCPCLNIIDILYIVCTHYSLPFWSSAFVFFFTWIVGAVAASQSMRCQSAKLIAPSLVGSFPAGLARHADVQRRSATCDTYHANTILQYNKNKFLYIMYYYASI